MNILLGNLKLDDIVEEEHLKTIKSFLDENGFKREDNCSQVKEQNGNYHIYDIPKAIMICGELKAQEFIKFLIDNDLVVSGFKEQVQVLLEKED